MLNIRGSADYDDSITSIQHHSYNPYTASFNNCDEIRIAIQQQDLCLLPSDSYLYIEGNIEREKDAAATLVSPKLVNNWVAFLFDEIRYELNGFEIDRCKNAGVTSLMKGYLSFTPNEMFKMEIAGWSKERKEAKGEFNCCIPLKNLFGFAEDYRSIIMNAKHELIIIRSRTDTNALVGDNNIVKFILNKIQWRIPHIQVNDVEKLRMLNYLDKKQPIELTYRSWELYEHPALTANDKHIWSVKTSSQVNTPRYIIIGFQTNRNNQIKADKSIFDHCQLTDLKVYLNSISYPYENLNIDFDKNKYSVLYDMYTRFQESFYHDRMQSLPLLTLSNFKDVAPLVAIDCSRQNEALKKSVIDIRIELQTKENICQQTSAYCMIIHDNIVIYNPYTSIVHRMI